MASEGPSKTDILSIFKRLRSSQCNKQCFDCQANNPTWASVTYGVFLCIDCSAVHRSLGVHVTFIRSTQLDTSWTWTQLRAMQLGGNAAATAFFRQHGCTSTDSQQKYHSRAAQMYREKLHSLALKAMKQYGTKIHIDSHHNTDSATPSPHTKDVDFFKEHEITLSSTGPEANGFTTRSNVNSAQPVPISNGNASNGSESSQKDGEADLGSGPSVDAALSMSPTQAVLQAEPRKATIGARKPTNTKKAKKLGAQKVKANFSDIETAAQQRDKDRDQLAAMAAVQEARTKEEEAKRLANMKLAYKDLSLEEKRRDEKLKTMDPKKAAQVERLGMGFGGSRESSHSAITEMKTIEQNDPVPAPRATLDSLSSRARDFDDDFEVIGGFSGPPKYNENPFGVKSEDKYSNWGQSKSSWDTMDRLENKQSNMIEEISTHNKSGYDDERSRARKGYDASGTDSSDNAQKKFGSAKSISSDAYFGKYDANLEMQQKLSSYSGSRGISSADLFGPQGGSRGGGGGGTGGYGGSSGPDLADIKEGVKQSVTTVAGKLSNLTSSVINSIQDHYG